MFCTLGNYAATAPKKVFADVATCGHICIVKPKSKRRTPAKQPKTARVNEPAAAWGGALRVNVRAAKDQFSSLIDKAANGEEVVITKNGKPTAKIVPFTQGWKPFEV